MLAKILGRIGVSLAIVICFMLFFSSSTFAAYTAKTQPNFNYKLLHAVEKAHVSSAAFHYQLLRTHVTINTSKANPNDPPEEDCLGIALTVTNPYPQEIQVVMGVNNYCGSAVTGVSWAYSTTDICNGQTYGGPNDSGSINLLQNGSHVTVANDWWEADCISNVSGAYTDFLSSTTGSADGSLHGQYVYGVKTTPEQTFY